MRILLAEDDPTIAKHLMDALKPAGYQVEHVSNGLEIWEKGGDGEFDDRARCRRDAARSTDSGQRCRVDRHSPVGHDGHGECHAATMFVNWD